MSNDSPNSPPDKSLTTQSETSLALAEPVESYATRWLKQARGDFMAKLKQELTLSGIAGIISLLVAIGLFVFQGIGWTNLLPVGIALVVLLGMYIFYFIGAPAKLDASRQGEIATGQAQLEAKDNDIASLKGAHSSEIGRIKEAHKSDIEQIQAKHGSTVLELVDAHTRGMINQEKKHWAELEKIQLQISEQATRIKDLTQVLFEVETKSSSSHINLYSYYDAAYGIHLWLYIRFENCATTTRTVKSVSVLVMRKNEDESVSEIPLTTHEVEIPFPSNELYETLFEHEDNPLLKTHRKWKDRDLVVSGGVRTLFHRIEGIINVSAEYQKLPDKNCFLRVTMDAIGQELRAKDFDVDWEAALKGDAPLTPRS